MKGFAKISLFFLLIFHSQLLWSDTKELLTVYTRPGCPHCEEAKVFLEKFQARHPEIQIIYFDVWENPNAMDQLRAFAKEKGVGNLAVPFFRGRFGYLVGFG